MARIVPCKLLHALTQWKNKETSVGIYYSYYTVIRVMSEQSAKRQKLAQDQLEHLSEFNAEGFMTFLKDYSEAIPYRTLYQTIARNKQLVLWFNQFADNEWWRKRTQNDFYDFYDAIIEPDQKTFNSFTENWLEETINIHENLWAKPWKIVYMVCYGMITLISTTDQELTIDDFVGTGVSFEAYRTTNVFSGDLVANRSSTDTTVMSWITGKELKTLRYIRSAWPLPVKNGFFQEDVETFDFYNREDNSEKTIRKFDQADVRTRNTSNLVIQEDQSSTWVNSTKFLSEIVQLEEGPKIILPIGLDYYLFGKTIAQYPNEFVTSIDVSTKTKVWDAFGPYNFTNTQFCSLIQTPDEKFYLHTNEGIYSLPYVGWHRPEYVVCSYGIVFKITGQKQDRLYLPSGKYITFKKEWHMPIVQVCGPFMCFSPQNHHEYQTIDLWSTLQKKRKEPIEFISSQHCANCGLIASIECDGCELAFCGQSCASENIISCEHKVAK